MIKHIIKNKLLGHSFVYLATSVVNSGLPFLLLPILTAYLNPAQYGNLGIFQAIYTVFLAIIGFGLPAAITRAKYEDAKNISVFIYNALQIVLFLFFILVALISIYMIFYDTFDFKGVWVLYALIYAFFTTIINIRLSLYQVAQEPFKFGFFQISNATLNIVLSLLFVIVISLNEDGRMLGMVASSFVFMLLAILLLMKNGYIEPESSSIYRKELINYGLPLVPHQLSTFFMSWLPLILVSYLIGEDSTGIYLFAFQISMILGVFCDAFNKSYVPWLFKNLGLKDDKCNKYIVKLSYSYFFIMVLTSTVSYFFAPFFISRFFNEEYSSAGEIVGLLIFGQALGGMYLMVTNYLFYSKKTALLSKITISTSIVGLLIIIILIKFYGLVGAAVGFLCMRLIMFFVTWYFAAKNHKMPWSIFNYTRP